MKELSNRAIGRITGLSIVIMAVLAGLVFGMYFDGLMSLEDAGQLVQAIEADVSAFRWATVGWLMILLTDLVAAWGLHRYYREQAPAVAQLMGWFRVLYSAVLAVAIGCLPLVLLVVEGQLGAGQPQLAQLFLQGFSQIWSLGLILFGVHLLLLGGLVYGPTVMQRILGVLLLIGGLGYMVVHLGGFLVPSASSTIAAIESVLMAPMMLGEVGLAFWLLFRREK